MTPRKSLQSLLALVILLGISASCATSRPDVKVLGVADAVEAPGQRDTLIVFVEVVNPTNRTLNLSRLEYRLDAASWFRAAGEIVLSRAVGPQSATVIELPVHLRRASRASSSGPAANPAGAGELVAYSLKGRLFAVSERVQRSWSVAAQGKFDAATAGARTLRVRTRVAGSGQ